MVLSAILAVSFIFVFGNMAWADRYHSEHHHYYGSDRHHKKYSKNHYQKHHKKHCRKSCPKSYGKYCPTCGKKYCKGYKKHVYYKKYSPCFDRRKLSKPYRHLPSRSPYFFSTSLFDPGFAMAFSIKGR